MPDTQRLSAALSDRYAIVREIGAGGMATVYLARDLKHDREVALKVLRADLSAVLGGERFLNEIKITARLDHPHILTLIDSGTAGGFLYYVLPYVRGESLRARLEREKQLSIEDAVAITTQVAGALEYAHRQGVVHRDIKPENILLQEGEAMLTDFGIALAVREAGGNRLTETGLSLGTPQYMSPEQATGERSLDARSDVYSLAAVLYEMLAGEPPVTGPTAQAIIAKLLTERPTRLRVVRDAVPEGLDAAVAKALAKTPADRFPGVREFAAALAHPDAPAPRRRHRWIRVAVAGGVLVALGAASWLALHGRSPHGAPVTPQLEQLTTDGDAGLPSLSPDGTRLASVARDCGAQLRCPERLVVRDTGGAGAITVLSGVQFFRIQWAAGGRYLVATVQDASGRFGAVAVPALGGPARFLGNGVGVVVGATDTMLLSPLVFGVTDSVTWLRWVSVGDGVVRDSMAVRWPGEPNVGVPAPAGGRVAVASWTRVLTIRLLDRAGGVTDSLVEPNVNAFAGWYWTPRSDALVWVLSPGAGLAENLSGAPGEVSLLRRRITADGRFAGVTDTVLRLPPGAHFSELRPDGTALLSQGPVDATVYALERQRPGRLDFRSRRLVASTAGLQAFLSRDGATVWLFRRGSGAGAERHDAFIPFAGGEQRPFTLPPGAVIDAEWTRPVSGSLLVAMRDGAGRARLVEVPVATGQARATIALPDRIRFVFSIPGGGVGAIVSETHSALVRGRPGKPDTTWSVPAAPGQETYPMGVAPDGRAMLSWARRFADDSLWIGRWSFDGSPSLGSPLVAMRLGTSPLIAFLPDGSAEYISADASPGVGWYRVGSGGGRPVRLGDAPLQGEINWSISDDGRRVVAVRSANRPDAYLIRNFGELLKR